MKKGFTLIELLAVIVILAIIALIATPVVLDIISNARESSNKRSIEMYSKAVEQAIARYNMINGESIYGFFKTNDGKLLTSSQTGKSLIVDYDGNVKCNYIHINLEGKVVLADCIVNGAGIDYIYAPPMKNMLYQKHYYQQENPTDFEFLNTNIKSAQIETLTIHTSDTVIDNANDYESKDCSFNQDKSVMCYWKVIENASGKNYYEFHIAADGEIYAPYDSSGLFYSVGYDKMTTLNLTGLNTKYAVNMLAIFAYVGHETMTTFNLGNEFDTSGVLHMRSMFYEMGFNELIKLDLGNKFDTSNVLNMRSMFDKTGYNKMTELNLGKNFDTSNVLDMGYMFCRTGFFQLQTLDLGKNFYTYNTTDMHSMFYETGSNQMTILILGEKFSIPETGDIEYIFYKCGKDDSNTRIYVSSQELKDLIQSLPTTLAVRNIWKTDNNIISVLS